MSFNAINQSMSDSVIKTLGETAIHHSHTGTVRTINAVIEQGVEVFTGGSESGVSEFRTKISFLRSDAPDWKRDDRIVSEDNNSYLLKDESDESDDVVVVVSAKHDGFSVRISARRCQSHPGEMSVTVPDGALIATTSGDYLVETTSGDYLVEAA